MNVDMTLFGQMITFALFIWFTMRFVWPPITEALEARQKKIADGIAAAERSTHELQVAQKKVREIIDEAHAQASVIIDQAQTRGARIESEARTEAQTIAQRIKTSAEAEVQQAMVDAKQALRLQVADIAIKGVEKLLERQVDQAVNEDILAALVSELDEQEGL